MPDPMDEPESEEMELVVPFVVCVSHGGPYDDDSFVAGFQCGEIDKMLTLAATAGATTVRAPYAVRTPLLPQLELLAMNRGFLVASSEADEETPEWTFVTFDLATELP